MLAQAHLFSLFFSLSMPTLGTAQGNGQPVTDTSAAKHVLLSAAEVVGTGNYGARLPEKSVLPVQCISGRQIQQMGVRNAGELLSRSLNIQVQQDNILGAGLSFQGLSGQNVKILVDDVPMIGRLNGNIDLSQINLSNIERVEIIEGPASVLFGTDALAGVINFITKKRVYSNANTTAQTPAKSVNIQANYHYESVGHHNLDASASWSGNNGRFWQSVMLDGGRNAFLGWSPTDTMRWKQWKPRIQYFVNGKYNFGTDKARFGYSGSFFDEFMLNRGVPLRPYNIDAFDDHYATRRYTNSLTANFDLSKAYSAKFIVSHNIFQRIKNTYFRDLTTLNSTQTANDGDQDTTKFSLITARGALIRAAKTEKINFEVGYDINIETGASLRLLNKTHQIGDYATFASAEWTLFSHDTEGGDKSSLVIRPGLRWSYNTSYQAPITPSLNLKWDISAAWVLRACYARGFRAPNLKELYFYFVDINHNIRGNESLLAERSHSANVSFFGKKAFNNTIAARIEAVGFFNDVENLITLAQIRAVENGTPEFGYVNIGRVQTLGSRLSGSLMWGNFTVMPGVNWLQRRSQFTREGGIFTANNMEYRVNMMYEIKPYQLTINYLLKHTGEQQGFAADEVGNVSINKISPYTMSDITLNKSFYKDKIRVNLGVKNLMNVTNVQAQMVGGAHTEGGSSTAIATGRTIFSSLTFQF